MERFSRTRRYYYLRLKRLKGNPRQLALGFTIGVFIGLTPTMPFHTVMILICCLITRSSFIAGVIASWIVCNPLTYVPIYYFSMVLGNYATKYTLNWTRIKEIVDIILSDQATISSSWQTIMSLGYEALAVLLVGGVILAIPFTLVSYYTSLIFFNKFAEKRKNKQILY